MKRGEGGRSAVQTPANSPPLWRPADPNGSGWAELLSIEPLVIHTLPAIGFPVGAASVIGPMVRDLEAHFLLMLSWTLEPPHEAGWLITASRRYLDDHPAHHLTFLTNTDGERRILAAAGLDAITLNHNCLVDDASYYPIPRVELRYDAVYNARLSPEKRVELAAEIDSLALIYFYAVHEFTVPEFHAEHARLRAFMPRAHFVNELRPDGCEWLMPQRINEILAQSGVGLCLSPFEGAMRASIEYLFAGLSVVSTPSQGGRDRYFDDDYCIIADPDPRSIREAVDALIARAVPREFVRAKTLARVKADRARFIALVQDIIDRVGGRMQFADRFWELTRGGGIIRWRSMPEFSATVAAAVGR